MRQSELFLKTTREAPKDEIAVNAQLLIRGNFIHKLMAGVYSYLPLGFRVRENVMKIIREEMNALGSHELLMPALQPKSAWEKTGRWEVLSPIMYQFKDHSDREIGLGPTHEEIIAEVAKTVIQSYADLPQAVYQIQTKFRDEARAKSGLLRGREFTMKDLYSFHTDVESLNLFYNKVKEAYLRVFARCGIQALITEASGGDFSKEYSHEFMAEAAVGEDLIMVCRKCNVAQNAEIVTEKKCAHCGGSLEETHGIEIGNIFKLGTKFSEPVGLLFKDKDGIEKPVIMASYGIGVERLIGTVVELSHDEKGIVWPREIAPFSVHLLMLGKETPELQKFGTRVYSELSQNGVETLYDDRIAGPGEKLSDADLLGMPYRIIVSEKTLTAGKVEIKARNATEAKLVSIEEALAMVKK
jgi:prolyl-tRNA synthetase